MALLKTIAFTLTIPGTVAVYLPWFLWTRHGEWLEFDPGPLRFLGLGPMALGAGIYLVCAAEFVRARGTPAPVFPTQELVVRGLYRYVRNPMYVGVATLLIGQALFAGSGLLLVYAASVVVVFHLFILIYEEPALRRQFGDSYVAYCRTVRRWLPGPPMDPRKAMAKEETRALPRGGPPLAS